MTRPMTQGGIESLLAHDSRDVWLVLMTIEADTGNLYLVNNNEPLTSRGIDFEAYPFEILAPNDTLDSAPDAKVTIGNVDQRIIHTLRSITNPPKFTFEIVRFSHPDNIEMKVTDLIMRSVSWDAAAITATLSVEDVFNQPFPSGSGTYSPRQFPSMF